MDELTETQDENTSENTEETSTKEPETFTREDLEETRRKAKSDALSEVGRLRAANEAAIKAAKRANERVEQILKEQDDAELAAAEGKEEVVSAIKERQKRRLVETELATAKQELDEEKAKTTEAQEEAALHTKERNAREVATRLGVDAKLLAELAKSTDGSVEAIEGKAKLCPKKGEAKTITLDSGKMSGGGGILKLSEALGQLDPSGMNPAEIHAKAVEIEKADKEGKLK